MPSPGQDGNITFTEFVAAFGLAEASVCFGGADDTDAEDITSHLAEEVMQQICSALYDRSHALQKARPLPPTSILRPNRGP